MNMIHRIARIDTPVSTTRAAAPAGAAPIRKGVRAHRQRMPLVDVAIPGVASTPYTFPDAPLPAGRSSLAGSFVGDAAASAARSLRDLARADLEQRLADVKAQARRIGNFRPEDEIELTRLLIERENLEYRLDRISALGRPFASMEERQ